MLKIIKSLCPILLFTGCAYWYVPSQPHLVNEDVVLLNDSIQMWVDENSSRLGEANLLGNYIYPVSGCFSGYSLLLKEGHSFEETYYSDIPHKRKVFVGRYTTHGDTLKLKYNRLFKNEYEFKILGIDSNVFLIPFPKLNLFYENFGNGVSKAIRDSSMTAKEKKIIKCGLLNETCFFKIN